MATKHKSSNIISLSKPASKKLAIILAAPQTKLQKQTIKRAAGSYGHYAEKWKIQK